MSRGFAIVSLAILCADSVQAHFVYLLPPADGRVASAIFADSPTKDDKVETAKIEFRTAQVVSAAGKTTTVTLEPETGGWRVPVTDGTAEVRATLEYGVVNRGEGQVIRLRYHARLLLGDKTDEQPAAEFDLVPVRVPGGTAFKVTFGGKPVGSVDVTVHEPGADAMKVLKTDTEGVTPAFAKPGRYSARAMHAEKKAGEFEGRKYALTHSYATATVTLK